MTGTPPAADLPGRPGPIGWPGDAPDDGGEVGWPGELPGAPPPTDGPEEPTAPR